MRKASHSAPKRYQQAPEQRAYRRAIEARTWRVLEEPWLKHPLPVMPDVEAYIAERGVTVCAPGQTSRKPKKPASKPARRRKKSKAADIPAPKRKRAADKQRAFLQRKGRADWGKFKKEHPQAARERLQMLKHFWSI